MLNEILEQKPSDAFARYGLAMEFSKNGRIEEAMTEFGKLLSANPDYTPGYFMAAQTLAAANRIDEAKKMLADGIVSAKRTGNAHAQSEMEGMLGELG
jgi:tetratricopeptide (TPR) repeat protein